MLLQTMTGRRMTGLAVGLVLSGTTLAQDLPPPAECVAPGPLLLADPVGDVNPLALSPSDIPQDNLDLRELNLSQATGEDGEEYIVFRLKAESLADGLVPSTSYFVSFMGSVDARVRGVRMQVDEQSVVSFFSYLASESNAGTSDGRFVAAGTEVPAHPSSAYGDDGEILIVVKATQLGLWSPGEALTGFNAATTFTAGGMITGTMDEMPDGLSRMGRFDYQDPASCQGAASRSIPLASAGGSLGLPVLLLGLLLGWRRRQSF